MRIVVKNNTENPVLNLERGGAAVKPDNEAGSIVTGDVGDIGLEPTTSCM